MAAHSRILTLCSFPILMPELTYLVLAVIVLAAGQLLYLFKGRDIFLKKIVIWGSFAVNITLISLILNQFEFEAKDNFLLMMFVGGITAYRLATSPWCSHCGAPLVTKSSMGRRYLEESKKCPFCGSSTNRSTDVQAASKQISSDEQP
jgi:hypothetical protein